MGFVLFAEDCSRALQCSRESMSAAATLISIVESSHDAIIGRNLEGIITAWNRGAERLYGYTAEEAIGKQISMLIPDAYKDNIPDVLAKTARGENIPAFDTQRLTKSGDVVDVSLTISPIKDAVGRVIGASTISRDISATKRTQEALRVAVEQYRLLFDSSPLPMWVFDRKTLAFLAVNEAAVRHYGFSREEFARLTVLDIRPVADVRPYLRRVRHTVAGTEKAETWRHRKKDGSIIDVEVTTHNVQFEGRDAELVLAHDVTERQRAENQLRHSEERFSKIFRSSPLGITITTEAEGRYVDANPAFLKMLGYERRDLIGRTAAELHIWDDPDHRSEWIHQFDLAQDVRSIVARVRTHSGEIRMVQGAGERVQLDNTPCILAIFQDVTETKRLEDRLRQAQKMEAVGRLTAGISHDFNNLLNVIIGYSEIAREHVHGKSQVTRHLDQIKSAGQRAAVLIRQLLAFSRQQILQPRVLNLNDVVNNVSIMLGRVIGEDIRLVFRPGKPLNNVYVDLGQMEQVLMNLAVNARDAMPEGGNIFIETSNVELDDNYSRLYDPIKPGHYVLLSVSDSGVGMDATTLSRIFEPFFTTKGSTGGTGLGLSTVYGIVQQSGGQILAYSELFAGTTFKIYLPSVDQPVDALSAKVSEDIRGGTETILVVEDDEELRSLTVSLLQEAGYTVLQAGNAVNAMNIAQHYEGKIDLLLSDVIMPGMSGRYLALEMKGSRGDTKVAYMSGYAGEMITHQGVLDPNITLLAKPFSRASLLTTVRNVLDQPKNS